VQFEVVLVEGVDLAEPNLLAAPAVYLVGHLPAWVPVEGVES
jgi:hypothetical protein